jgi:hypothetical protein
MSSAREGYKAAYDDHQPDQDEDSLRALLEDGRKYAMLLGCSKL